jgi:hypothetical protein
VYVVGERVESHAIVATCPRAGSAVALLHKPTVTVHRCGHLLRFGLVWISSGISCPLLRGFGLPSLLIVALQEVFHAPVTDLPRPR